MIDRRFPFEDCVVHIQVQGTDRSGNLWGVIDVLTPDGTGHLIAPRRLSLFEDRDWHHWAMDTARRNSGNVAVWNSRGEALRIGLIEDEEVTRLLTPTNSTTQQSFIESGVVELEVVRLSERERPGQRHFQVEGLVPERTATLVHGDSGHGKSYLVMIMAQCVALGTPFLGMATTKASVLYVDWELDEEEQTRRAFEVAQGLGNSEPPDGFDYVRMDYSLADCLEWLAERVVTMPYGLLVLDSFGLACGGDPEAARFAIPFFRHLRSLRCSVLVVDHQSRIQPGQKYRDKDAFGSVYKRHLSRSAVQVQLLVEDQGKRGLVLRHTKSNFGPLLPDIYAWMEFAGGGVSVDLASSEEMAQAGAADELSIKDQILVVLRESGPSTAEQVAELAGLNNGTVGNMLRGLKRNGLVNEAGKDGKAIMYEAIDHVRDEE